MNPFWNKIKNFKDLKDLSSLGIGNIASTGISGLFWFYLAALIGTEGYGELSYLLAIAGIASTVASIGSGYTTIVYTAKKINILPATFIITIIGSATAAFAIYLALDNPALSGYVLLYVVFNLGTATLMGLKQFKKNAIYLISQKILMVVLVITLYYFFENDGVILGYALSFLIFSPIIYKQIKINGIQFSVLIPRLGFMFNSYGTDLVKAISGNMDKLIIGPLFGLSLLGNYHLGMQFLVLATLIPNIIVQYTLPRDSSGENNDEIKKYIIIFSILIAISGIIIGPTIINLVFPEYSGTIEIIQIMILAIIPKTISLMYMSKFLGMEKSKFVIVGSIVFVLVQIPTIILFGEITGIIGIAISLVVAETAQAIFYIISNKFLMVKIK